MTRLGDFEKTVCTHPADVTVHVVSGENLERALGDFHGEPGSISSAHDTAFNFGAI